MRKNRIEKLRVFFDTRDIDAVLISGKEDIFYLAGYSNQYCAMLITRRDCIFFTDYTFYQDAEEHLKTLKVRCLTNPLMEEIGQLLIRMKVKSLGVDSKTISYHDYLMLKMGRNKISVVPMENMVGFSRSVKERSEINFLKKALHQAEDAFMELASCLKPDMKESEIAFLLNQQVREHCGDIAFPSIVLAGLNTSKPHAEPSQKRVRKGELIIMDFGGKYDGYNSDTTRTLMFSKPTSMQKKIYSLVLQMMDKCITMIKPGVRCDHIAKETRKILKKDGYEEYFRYPLGHGIGLSVHEMPFVAESEKSMIEENNIICLEPGVFIPGWGGIRIENTVLVKKSGAEIMNNLNYNRIWML